MIRWVLDRKWLPITIFSGSLLIVSASFELINRNIAGLTFSVLLALGIFLSQRFTWYAIGIFPIASYFLATQSSLPFLSLLLLGFLVFFLSIHGSRNQRLVLLGIGSLSGFMIGALVGYQGNTLQRLLAFRATTELARVNSTLIVLVLTLSLMTSAFVAGRLVIMRYRHIGSPVDLAQNAVRANELELEIAKQNERLEIAKDLSEQLVQRVSAVVSISEGGRYAIVADPDSAGRVLERTFEAGRAAQAELRRLYDYLNSAIVSDVESFRIEDLNDLAVAYRELGFNTVISQQGEDFALNQGMELCVYKIVFEALKNVRKHAPIGTDVDIDFLWVDDGLQVLVKDNGIEVTNRLKRNIGELVEGYTVKDDLEGLVQEFDGATLSALRDRAAIYKGRIEATKVPGVGFTLSAIFPNLRSLSIQEH